MMVIKDLNFIEVRILINIFNVKNHRLLTSFDIARQLDINPSHPYFRKVLRLLEQEGIIEVMEKTNNYKALKINHNKLDKLIHDQEIVNFIVNKYLWKAGFPIYMAHW